MPPPLTISSSANSRTAATIAAPALGQLGRRAPLHEADRRAPQPPARRPVADPGDLALVGHQRDEFDLRPPLDLARQRHRLLDRVDGRALRPDLDPPAQRPPAGVEVDADADRRRARAQHRLDQRRGARRSRPSRSALRPGGRPSAAPARRARRCRRSGRRAAGPRSPARPARASRAACRSAARRSARRAAGSRSSSARQRTDLLATRIGLSPARPSIVVRVGPHRVEVDEGERRLDLGEDPLVALVRLIGWDRHPRRAYPRRARLLPTIDPDARRGGRVAEGTRLLSE